MDETNIIGALRHHNRVCKIYYRKGFKDSSLLEEFAAINEPFPALTNLKLVSFSRNVPVLPDSFLGGSAPSAITRLAWHSLSVNWKPTFIYHSPCLAFPLGYSPFRIYFTRDDRPLSVHVAQARITFPWIPTPSISGPSSKPTSAPAHSCSIPNSRPFRLPRRYGVLGGRPVSNRNTHAHQKLLLFLQSTNIRHSTTWALHPSHGNIHDTPCSTRTMSRFRHLDWTCGTRRDDR